MAFEQGAKLDPTFLPGYLQLGRQALGIEPGIGRKAVELSQRKQNQDIFYSNQW